MRDKILTSISTFGFLGYSRFMPGTLGAFLGTAFSYFLFGNYSRLMILAVSIGLIIFAVYVCSVAERVIGCRDPSCVILDEFVAMPVCFLFLRRRNAAVFLLGFLIFRAFDILKPLGIKFFEKFRGGLGIVLDDIMAACYTNITLHTLSYLVRNCVKTNL
ncbi:MAG: phosphatidylglycerophosphatase A [Puniceicoccales bacterium]|jgi:phosphatidylglycerophosphatase A|nr:phosphatidylglycerophosphatase A [Puniceicoccales bacterium]